MAKETKEKGKMTMAEAGRRGGRKVKEERGREYYAEIGRKGSRARWNREKKREKGG
jgi:general stress protein YciG